MSNVKAFDNLTAPEVANHLLRVGELLAGKVDDLAGMLNDISESDAVTREQWESVQVGAQAIFYAARARLVELEGE